MANFGDNLRNWVNTDWEPRDEEFTKLFDKEWNRVTKSLITTTPEGQIRFILIDYGKLTRKINFVTNLHFHKRYDFENMIQSLLKERSLSDNSFALSDFDQFPPYAHDHWKMKVQAHERPYDPFRYKCFLLFYANNIESNPYYGKDLITYWFESHVLPAFEKEFKSQKNDSFASKECKTFYYYSPIKKALEHFNCTLTDEEYKIIFTELCNKHGINLEILDVYETIWITL